MLHKHILIPALVLAWSSPCLGQLPIDLTGKPERTIREPFTDVTGIRALPGNRAIVTDQFERRVFLVDFAAGTARQIGRDGDGPREYRFPMTPMAAPRGGTWIFDAILQRVHVLSPEGGFGASIGLPVMPATVSVLAARGTDQQGGLFFEGNSLDQTSGRFLDSVAVVRWSPGQDGTEMVGKVWSGGRVRVQRAEGIASVARSAMPFPHIDAWAVLPDGRIAVVQHEPYSLCVLRAREALHCGTPIAYAPISVTAIERDAYRSRHPGRRLVATGGGESAQAPPIADAEFPRAMPPFIASTVIASPDGEVWVGRSHSSADRTWHYDIFSAEGRVIGAATLPTTSRVVGFGDGVVYVVRKDPADDLAYLERYRR